jgi:hypothetical protein
MAQFDYLGTWQDSWAILNAILEPGDVRLIPDLKYLKSRPNFRYYTKPEPLIFTSLNDELKEIMLVRRAGFLFSDKFSRSPPWFDSIEIDGQKQYYVRSSCGGPCLDLTLPACYEAEGLLKLASAHLYYARHTWNPATEVWEPPSLELRAGYKEILNRMKRHLVRHRFHMDIWTGRDALQLLQHNKARITGFERPS